MGFLVGYVQVVFLRVERQTGDVGKDKLFFFIYIEMELLTVEVSSMLIQFFLNNVIHDYLIHPTVIVMCDKRVRHPLLEEQS